MRDVQRTERFNEQIAAFAGNDRLDEAMEAAWEILCSRPETFPTVANEDWRYFRTVPFPGLPALIIVFRFDAEHVYLLRAEACADASEEDDDSIELA